MGCKEGILRIFIPAALEARIANCKAIKRFPKLADKLKFIFDRYWESVLDLRDDQHYNFLPADFIAELKTLIGRYRVANCGELARLVKHRINAKREKACIVALEIRTKNALNSGFAREVYRIMTIISLLPA